MFDNIYENFVKSQEFRALFKHANLKTLKIKGTKATPRL